LTEWLGVLDQWKRYSGPISIKADSGRVQSRFLIWRERVCLVVEHFYLTLPSVGRLLVGA
jgi:hypothetical protein